MTSMFPTELAVIRTKLESEGIKCYIPDEHTAQVHNFLSQAIGGVRLQVEESKYEQACKILLDNGFIKEDGIPAKSNFEKAFESSLFKKIFKSFIYLLVSFILIMIGILCYNKIFNQPTDRDLLIHNNWCLDFVVYQDQEFYPFSNTNSIRIHSAFSCSEKIYFRTDNVIDIPGFETPRIKGNWTIENDKIKISSVETLKFIFERTYEIEFHSNTLVLTSDSLDLYCYKFHER